MKISLNEITEEGVSRIVIARRPEHNTGFVFPEEPRYEVTLKRIDEITAHAAGVISGIVHSVCGRCAEPLEWKIHEESEYIYRVGKDLSAIVKEHEVSDEDSTVVYLETPLIDLRAAAEEQLFLALPEKLLCRNDCKGMCYTCGVSLNTEECSCEGASSESPFAVLKKLKNRQ